MPKVGLRRIRTVFDEKPRPDSETRRIRIPQPVERPLNIHGKDVIRNEYLRKSPWWYTLHKRGLKRQKVGLDYLESRAISKSQLRGTLPERIVYLYLIKNLHMKDGADFTFQTSLQGGRMELGGIVADFEFPIMKLILNVQGSTHEQFLRMRKDEEQRAILEDMGYRVFELTDVQIYNEPVFENEMRKMFVRGSSGGGYSQEHVIDENPGTDQILQTEILDGVLMLLNKIGEFSG